jgi:fatty acid desaturase
MGGIYQGFSPVWWKDRHNSHHAATNILDSDPDIDNLPLFVWTTHDFPRVESFATPAPATASSENENEEKKNTSQTTKSSSPYAYMEYQAYYFLIFCATLRLIWLAQSLRFVFDLRSPRTSTSKNYSSRFGVEASMLIIHWMLFALIVAFLVPGILPKILFTIVSQGVAGFCIAIIVFFNHYACEHFPHSERGNLTFIELQLRTTRNGTPSFFFDWFAGGLNYQIEHHLFPTMPRHNLLRASHIIKKFCHEIGLPYQSCDFIEGVVLIHKQLASVASQIRERNKKFQ